MFHLLAILYAQTRTFWAYGVSVVTTTDKPVYKTGQTANITVTLHNLGKTDVVWQTMLAKPFDVRIMRVRSANRPMAGPPWLWSKGRVFPMVMGNLKVPPGGTIKRTFQWPLTDDSGRAVGAGHYQIFGQLTTNLSVPVTSQNVTVTVK